jgi:8-oxo-dGTP pyrophosphatase MutT (NUDIX family)
MNVPVTHEVAIIVLRDGDGSYFLHQRRPDKSTFPSRWGVGAGGRIDAGEEPGDAAQRELWEEAGCAPHLQYCFDLHYVDENVDSKMHVYEATVNREDVGFDDSEWTDARWCSEDELIDLAGRDDTLCPDTAAFVRKYLRVAEANI